MTKQELEDLRKAYEASTQGEWKTKQVKFGDFEIYAGHDWNGDTSKGDTYMKLLEGNYDGEANTNFAALAHNQMSKILKHIETLEEKNLPVCSECYDGKWQEGGEE